jgi:hypothetical protein
MNYLQAGGAVDPGQAFGTGAFLPVLGIGFLVYAMFEARSPS